MSLCSSVYVKKQSQAGSFHSGEGGSPFYHRNYSLGIGMTGLQSWLLTSWSWYLLASNLYSITAMFLIKIGLVLGSWRLWHETLSFTLHGEHWNIHVCMPKINSHLSNFFNYLAITFVFHLAPPEFLQLGASWTIVIPPITANHLLINMEQSRFRNTSSATDSSTGVESESSNEMELTQCRVQNTALLAA
jgi:hypothetical protein